jgi:3-oxo-5-alpha-steroid 4-dehydrogenase 1
MEIPSPVLFLYWYFQRSVEPNWNALLFLFLWQLHYFHRAILYPFFIKVLNDSNIAHHLQKANTTPFLTVIFAFGFNIINSYVNSRYIFKFGNYPASYFTQWNFQLGREFFPRSLIFRTRSLCVWTFCKYHLRSRTD